MLVGGELKTYIQLRRCKATTAISVTHTRRRSHSGPRRSSLGRLLFLLAEKEEERDETKSGQPKNTAHNPTDDRAGVTLPTRLASRRGSGEAHTDRAAAECRRRHGKWRRFGPYGTSSQCNIEAVGCLPMSVSGMGRWRDQVIVSYQNVQISPMRYSDAFRYGMGEPEALANEFET